MKGGAEERAYEAGAYFSVAEWDGAAGVWKKTVSGVPSFRHGMPFG